MGPLTGESLRNARTIVHELTFLAGTPASRFEVVEAPALVMASDHTAPPLLDWAAQLADSMPQGVSQTLPGEWHGVDDATLTAAMSDFLLD